MPSPIQTHFFRLDDEMMFKRQYAIQFLASFDSMKHDENSQRGSDIPPSPANTARAMACRAWEEWKNEIGVLGGSI